MTEFIKNALNILNVISLCGVIIVGILGCLYDLIGYANFQKALASLGFDKGFERLWVIGVVMLFLLIITYFIKMKIKT